MRPDRFRRNDTDSLTCRSIGGSFRRTITEISPDIRSSVSTASKALSCSKRAFTGLKEFSRAVLDFEVFSTFLEDWVYERLSSNSSNKTMQFKSPFTMDSLRELDHALEGVLFQQLCRMPTSRQFSDGYKEEQLLALEEFLRTSVEGLWRTFWNKRGSIPFSISCPLYPWSKFYTVEKAIANGRIDGLCGAAVLADSENKLQTAWSHVLELALLKADIRHGHDTNFSSLIVCEALFHGFHILLSRSLSNHDAIQSSLAYVLVLDSKYGGVIEFEGDLSKLDIDAHNPYLAVVEWIKQHAEIKVSLIERVWNKLGNPSWGDVGTLQLLLATYKSIIHANGPPRKSVESLAAENCFRLQMNGYHHRGSIHHDQEIVELDHHEDYSIIEHSGNTKLKKDEIVLVEDSQGQKGFQVKEILHEGHCLSYVATSLDQPSWFLNMYVGVHSSKLEPSWEAMSLWYNVQRQAKVLKIMKQRGLSSKILPEMIVSGQILHSEPCTRTDLSEACDHPLCGSPVLITSPVGETLSSIVALDGPFSSDELLRCCRDVLTALKTTTCVNIYHGNLCPENIIRLDSKHYRTGSSYMLVSWGRAVMEDRDSPTLNLQFSSTFALQHRKLCPSSDVESLVYVLYLISGGKLQEQDSIESAVQWRERCWTKRIIQQHFSEISPLLKAFADYVDSIYGTPYPIDYDIWLSRLNQSVTHSEIYKSVGRLEGSSLLEDGAAESSRTSGDCAFSD